MLNDVDKAATGGSLPPLPSRDRLQELLFDATRLGRVDVIPALLQAGALIDAHDRKGYTPLILASYHGHCDATELLLDEGVPIDQPDTVRGNTALMGVAFKGYAAIANLLIDRGADINRTNHAGQTALMMASLFGHHAIVDRLLAAGADRHLVDDAGNSALSLAQGQSHGRMVDRLGNN